MGSFPDRTEVQYDELMRKVTATVSGWDGGFHTTSNNVTEPKKVIPITTQEILAKLKELKEVCNKTTIERLFRAVTSHANNKNNPHNTNLAQFSTDILHMLYGVYQERGGIATYDAFIHILFDDYQIAGLDDVLAGTDSRLLVTVNLAAKYVELHNSDKNAHASLFKRLYPGEPILYEPTMVIMSWFKIPNKFQKNTLSMYTYVGQDRKIYTSLSSYLPIDYIHGVPTVALFGDRTNMCKWSNDFSKEDTFTLHNVIIDQNEANPSVDNGKTTLTKITDSVDINYTDHGIYLLDLFCEANKTYNLSVAVKPINSLYYCVKVRNITTNDVIHVGFVNLEKGSTLTTDNDNQSYLTYIPLYDDTYQFQFSFNNLTEATYQIEIIPYLSITETTHYKGTGQDLCYMGLVQFEEGFGVSPFIYTGGEALTRYGTVLEIPLQDDWFNIETGGFKLEMISPIPLVTLEKIKTVYSFVNDANEICMSGSYDINNLFEAKIFDINNTQIYGYPVSQTSRRSRSIAFAYDGINMTVAATNNEAKTISIINPRRKDATKLFIGHENNQNHYDGYFKNFIFYDTQLNPNNVTFLAGE